MKRFFAVLSVLVLISACGSTATAKPATNNTTELNLHITPTLNGTEVRKNFYVEIQNIKDLENIEILHSSISKLPGKIKLEVNNISKNPEYMVKIISEEYIRNYIIHPKPNTKTQKHKIPIKPTPKQIKKNIQEKGGINNLKLNPKTSNIKTESSEYEEHWTKVGKLHTVEGLKNHWDISTDSVLKIEGKYAISAYSDPPEDENSWQSDGYKDTQSLVNTDIYATMSDKCIYNVEASVEYKYWSEYHSSIGMYFHYITPYSVKDLQKEFKDSNCDECGSGPNSGTIKTFDKGNNFPQSFQVGEGDGEIWLETRKTPSPENYRPEIVINKDEVDWSSISEVQFWWDQDTKNSWIVHFKTIN